MLDRFGPKRTLAIETAPPPRKLIGAIAVSAILVLAVAAQGCGGSSKSSTTATLSKSQFLAQGNAICAQGNQRFGAADKALGNQPTAAQITAFVASTFAPDIQGQIDGLRSLSAPAGDKATVSNMLAVAQTDLDKIKSNPTLLAGGSGFAQFAQLAHPYGLTACAPSS